MEGYIYYVGNIPTPDSPGHGWYGTWWDLFFSGIDPLLIRRAKVVSIDADRN
jgi:hypothetical protein